MMDSDMVQNSNAAKNAYDAELLKVKEKKRTRRDSSNRSKETVTVSAVSNGSTAMNGVSKKNGKFGDRKSRSLYGRGLPKKGGGGGKGTWGKLGDELEQVSYLDDHDPNYDSEEENNAISYKPVKPEWNRDEIEKTVVPILKEFFEHAQTTEVIEALSDINIRDKKALVIICLITLAMERKNEFRELASQLLLALSLPKQHVHMNGNGNHSGQLGRPFLNSEDIRLGFLSLCDDLPDLILDTPDAAQVLGKFLARAIFDQVLSSEIIDVLKDDPDFTLSMTCAKEAQNLLSIPHYDLKIVWGKAGGIQPVSVLKTKMTTLLKEYLSSGDSEEAMRCATDLDVPHFHHELVYEAVLMAIEVSTERAGNMLVHLLKRFADTAIVTTDQITQGFVRIYNEMPDVNLDVPNAYFYLEQIVNKCYDLKVIGLKLKVQAPNRSRKRFVSEGDGGKLKNYRNDNYFDLV
uniref:Programmed cell death protein 4-like n=1 Tax=Phallusia mammillata TaxID=59560 RepID=A0A6F9DMS2_9ASCI|nr:programmed cell death protein 4-like [Phallusia mammillata]